MIFLLKPAELAYRGVNRLNRFLYTAGVRRQTRLPRPVISIGNISMGGSGKTPTTIAVVEMLLDAGQRPVVLTRGYARGSSEEGIVVDAADPGRFGDEPAMMFRRFGNRAPIVVGSERAKNALDWLESNDCDLFVLDDGFQHLGIARDLDVVIDGGSGWLREGRSALLRADLVVKRLDPGEERAADCGYTARMIPTALVRGDERRPSTVLDGERVVAFSGLARNGQFHDMLHELGAFIREQIEYPDHHSYSEADIGRIRRKAAGQNVELIVTTEKDWVKVSELADGFSYLEVSMQIEPETSFRERVLAVTR